MEAQHGILLMFFVKIVFRIFLIPYFLKEAATDKTVFLLIKENKTHGSKDRQQKHLKHSMFYFNYQRWMNGREGCDDLLMSVFTKETLRFAADLVFPFSYRLW